MGAHGCSKAPTKCKSAHAPCRTWSHVKPLRFFLSDDDFWALRSLLLTGPGVSAVNSERLLATGQQKTVCIACGKRLSPALVVRCPDIPLNKAKQGLQQSVASVDRPWDFFLHIMSVYRPFWGRGCRVMTSAVLRMTNSARASILSARARHRITDRQSVLVPVSKFLKPL